MRNSCHVMTTFNIFSQFFSLSVCVVLPWRARTRTKMKRKQKRRLDSRLKSIAKVSTLSVEISGDSRTFKNDREASKYVPTFTSTCTATTPSANFTDTVGQLSTIPVTYCPLSSDVLRFHQWILFFFSSVCVCDLWVAWPATMSYFAWGENGVWHFRQFPLITWFSHSKRLRWWRGRKMKTK